MISVFHLFVGVFVISSGPFCSDPYVTGTSVLGIKYKDGVLIAADTLGECTCPLAAAYLNSGSMPCSELAVRWPSVIALARLPILMQKKNAVQVHPNPPASVYLDLVSSKRFMTLVR